MLPTIKQLMFPALILLLLCEPALANKFETIGNGVAGNVRMKREFLQWAFLIFGSGFITLAVLAVIVPRTNAAWLNYTNWKMSAIILALIGLGLLSIWRVI